MRSARRLVTGLGLAFLIGVPALAVSALAETEAQQRVEFSGGGTGVCDSRPDPTSLTVKAESRLLFVNDIGQAATLRIDGANNGPVADGQAVEIQFHRGPVSIAMVPACLSTGDGSYGSVIVDVTSPRPTSASSSGPKTTVRERTTPRPKPSPTKAPMPAGGSNAVVGGGQRFSLGPDGGVQASSDPEQSLGPAGVADDSSPVNASVVGDTPTRGGIIGLLTLIATVCIVGVTLGAIRIIVNQRASRAELA